MGELAVAVRNKSFFVGILLFVRKRCQDATKRSEGSVVCSALLHPIRIICSVSFRSCKRDQVHRALLLCSVSLAIRIEFNPRDVECHHEVRSLHI